MPGHFHEDETMISWSTTATLSVAYAAYQAAGVPEEYSHAAIVLVIIAIVVGRDLYLRRVRRSLQRRIDRLAP